MIYVPGTLGWEGYQKTHMCRTMSEMRAGLERDGIFCAPSSRKAKLAELATCQTMLLAHPMEVGGQAGRRPRAG